MIVLYSFVVESLKILQLPDELGVIVLYSFVVESLKILKLPDELVKWRKRRFCGMEVMSSW